MRGGKKNMEKRKVDIVIISDVHLGTYGCHAKELLQYLKSIEPGTLILNGDIIDMWQFRKSYWPDYHMRVVKEITDMIATGIPVYYLTGNHDDMLRKFSDIEMGSFELLDKLVIRLNGKRAWIFHGDVFDISMKHSKWLAKLGAHGYDLLILLNRFINYGLEKLGREKISLSKRIKDSVKSAVKYIGNFEETVAEIAIQNNYHYVICGHIHQPVIKEISTAKGKVVYLNSGDWVENLTALEYSQKEWSLYHFSNDPLAKKIQINPANVKEDIQWTPGLGHIGHVLFHN